MYHVATVNLTPDASDLDPAAGTVDRGEMSAGEVGLLLEAFRDLNLVETGEDDPHVEITGPSGKFHVRTSQGRLFLYNARAPMDPYVELTATEIVVQLERSVVTAPPFRLAATPAAPEPTPPAPRRSGTAQRAIAAGILGVGLLVNAYTIYVVTSTDSVSVRPNVTLLTDAKEIVSRRTEIVGTYVTGDRTGDRLITIRPDGQVAFAEIGRSGNGAELTDTYQLGRRGTKLCLVTGDGSVIDVVNLETLTYFRDNYRRKS